MCNLATANYKIFDMAKINTQLLEGLIDNQLRQHDYYSFGSMTWQHCLINDEDIYDALLNPQKSPYFDPIHLENGATIICIRN